LCTPTVSSAVRLAGLRPSRRWRSQMWRSWAGVITHGLWLWGRVGRTAKFSKTMFEAAYGREMNIKLSGNRSGRDSCSQQANCTLPQNFRHRWHCVTNLHICERPFIVLSTWCPGVMIMLFNKQVDGSIFSLYHANCHGSHLGLQYSM
jgi:hypothetical protein